MRLSIVQSLFSLLGSQTSALEILSPFPYFQICEIIVDASFFAQTVQQGLPYMSS